MKSLFLALLGCATFANAWLPAERGLFGGDEVSGKIRAGSERTSKRWLPFPSIDKIRGVNLGGMFVFEPWMAQAEWKSMGCGEIATTPSEFDCVLKLGQDAADKAFQAHWSRYITKDDIDTMAS